LKESIAVCDTELRSISDTTSTEANVEKPTVVSKVLVIDDDDDDDEEGWVMIGIDEYM
jgi:hypothetical protein